MAPRSRATQENNVAGVPEREPLLSPTSGVVNQMSNPSASSHGEHGDRVCRFSIVNVLLVLAGFSCCAFGVYYAGSVMATAWGNLALRRRIPGDVTTEVVILQQEQPAKESYQESNFHSLPPEVKILHISDMHVDPWYVPTRIEKHPGMCRDPKCLFDKGRSPPVDIVNQCQTKAFSRDEEWQTTNVIRVGCDPPLALLRSALKQFSCKEPLDGVRPDLILFTGDSAAHDLGVASAVTLARKRVLSEISTAFPGIPVVFTIGNNDLSTPNVMKDSDFQEIYDDLRRSCKSCPQSQLRDQKHDFLGFGRHSVRLPDLQLMVISLNTGFFSPLYNIDDLLKWSLLTRDEFIEKQLSWMKKRLEAARRDRVQVIIIGHNPPGYFYEQKEWFSAAFKGYLQLCEEYKDVIVFQTYGHHSKDMFRSFSKHVSVFVNGGITPQGGQSPNRKEKDAVNPSVRVFFLRRDHEQNDRRVLKDVKTYFADVGRDKKEQPLSTAWKLSYSFCKTYGVADCTPQSMQVASEKIREQSQLSAFYVSASTTFVSSLRHIFVHDMTNSADTL